jgi:hypothetical protein
MMNADQPRAWTSTLGKGRQSFWKGAMPQKSETENDYPGPQKQSASDPRERRPISTPTKLLTADVKADGKPIVGSLLGQGQNAKGHC